MQIASCYYTLIYLPNNEMEIVLLSFFLSKKRQQRSHARDTTTNNNIKYNYIAFIQYKELKAPLELCMSYLK